MADNNFVNIKIKIGSEYKNVSIEKGVSFENNGAQYVVDKDGNLHKFDKSTNVWSAAKSIEMTNYQYKAFLAVANNDAEEEEKKGNRDDNLIKQLKNNLSIKDITMAMEKYSDSKLSEDLKKELPSGYTVEKHDTGYTNKLKNGVEVGIAYNDNHQAALKFEIASKSKIKEATKGMEEQKSNTPERIVKVSKDKKIITVEYRNNPPTPKILQENMLKGGIFSDKYENVEFIEPEVYTVQKGDTIDQIIKNYGIDFYELFAANPELNYKVEYSKTDLAKISMIGYIHEGDKINIPARYKIKPGSVKNLDDVIKATGVTREYVENILIQMEPTTPGKPDLEAYYDKINGKGALTIGFGHTGPYLNNRPLVEGATITEEEAYEILAQDIINNKVRALAYLDQHGISKKDFDKIPESLQSIIIDVPFNKGIYDGFENEHHDYTNILKEDISKQDYAMAVVHTNRISNVIGLEKRSMYRLICAMENLDYKDKVTVRDSAQAEVDRVVGRLMKRSSGEAEKLKKAWESIDYTKPWYVF